VSRNVVAIAGKRLSLANLEKELYPAAGFTKAHVLAYYRRMAAVILPHLQGRALTMKRYPDGVTADYFFEKRCPPHPDWVQTAELELKAGERLHVCLVNDLATLIWVANLASLELHVPLARAGSAATPDAMVFDLDPGEPADVLACARVALILRELLSRLRLASFAKTSGRKGLHLFVPLNSPGATFAATKEFSRSVALVLQKNYPELVTAKMAREERQGRVFINWSQNDATKTMICVYSLRAREEPLVSFPLSWGEVASLATLADPQQFRISQGEAMQRIEKTGDLFKEVLEIRQKLPHL
jgi:bifunctional non-homologous end joining protein LigD